MRDKKKIEDMIIKQLKEDRSYDDEYLEHHVRYAIKKTFQKLWIRGKRMAHRLIEKVKSEIEVLKIRQKKQEENLKFTHHKLEACNNFLKEVVKEV